VLATTITSADIGKLVYLNTTSTEWQLITNLGTDVLFRYILGVLSAVTLNGDTLGTQGSGTVVIQGEVAKTGATVGQVFYSGSESTIVSVPPTGTVTRAGYCLRAGYMIVDISLASASTAAAEPVYVFAATDSWDVVDGAVINLGLDDEWTEGSVAYNTDLGNNNDEWATLP
jgi:hypothetical protein